MLPNSFRSRISVLGRGKQSLALGLEDRSTRHISGEWIWGCPTLSFKVIPPEPPDCQGLSFISSLLRGKLVLLLPTETHPTWDGERREQCPCQGGFLGMQVPGLRGMKLLMKWSDRSQM